MYYFFLLYIHIYNIQGPKSIQKAYDNLSIFAVFLNQAYLDEVAVEDVLDESLHEEIERIEENQIYWLLCKLQIAMEAHPDSSIDPTVTDSVMHSKYKAISDRSARHIRDYVILREFSDLLYYLHLEFKLLRGNALKALEYL